MKEHKQAYSICSKFHCIYIFLFFSFHLTFPVFARNRRSVYIQCIRDHSYLLCVQTFLHNVSFFFFLSENKNSLLFSYSIKFQFNWFKWKKDRMVSRANTTRSTESTDQNDTHRNNGYGQWDIECGSFVNATCVVASTNISRAEIITITITLYTNKS